MQNEVKPYGRIYYIVNQVTRKIYVGQTIKTLLERWRTHLSYVQWGGDGYLQKSIRKYGSENFTINLLCEAYSKSHLDTLENYYINLFETKRADKGYNLSFRAPRGVEGRLSCSEKQKGDLNHYYRHDLLDEDLTELYNSGNSLSSIAKMSGCSRQLVGNRLNDLGVEIITSPNKKNLDSQIICYEYLLGKPLSVLAKNNEVSAYVIRRILKENNVELRKEFSVSSDRKSRKTGILITTQQIVDDVNAGMTQRDIALKYNIPRSAVQNRLKSLTSTPKKIPVKSGISSPVFRSDINTEDLIQEYNSGISTHKLAKKYSTGKTTIIKRLENAGVKLRTPKEAQLINVQQSIIISGSTTGSPKPQDSPLGCEDVRRPRDPEIAVARVRNQD